jgi:hypothetical protein
MRVFTPVLESLVYHVGQVPRPQWAAADGQRFAGAARRRRSIWKAKRELADHPSEVYEVGLHHLALHVEKREQVDQVNELVRPLGAEILDGPAEFPYAGPDDCMRCIFLDPTVSSSKSSTCRRAEQAYTETMRALERGTTR